MHASSHRSINRSTQFETNCVYIHKQTRTEQTYTQVDDHLACAVAGITADANILINYGKDIKFMFVSGTICILPE
jgi:hypothetical protein